ncbi:hypothetical protein CRG98_038466 [Punica granatum]|uniref:Retrotransposon gag domain-containing protein n=1 Tax=Punica granatum TaxID=22663 RepID=A0A2I0IBG8_PUNGR|nr:hypothetical protein CRG98_038466 [Punica granatum]
MKEGQAFEAYATEWRGRAAKHIPPITERQQVQMFHSTLRGVYYSHLLAHTSSFSDLIEAGKKLDMGVKLGRIEGPSKKKDGETSKKQTAGTSRRSKDMTIGVVNSEYQASQPISVDYTPALQTSQAYAHLVHYVQPYQTSQAYFPTPPTVIQSQLPQQHTPAQAQQGRPPASRSPQSVQRAPAPRTHQDNVAQLRPRKQYTTLPASLSHIFRQLLVGNKIRTEAPGPNFDPAVQNQNLYCEFHRGALGHTLDDCWALRNRIQEMIDTRQISFNEVKPPNVRANPLPDHGSGSGPSINMEMSAMDITRSGRVYQGPESTDKGKAPVVISSAVPEAVPLLTKKVTDQEAEAFMKVIKASEYKVVEQMGKSPAHISLLALLLSSEPHRNALLKVLTTAQVPKDTASDNIEETVSSIFSNQISFADEKLPSEGQGHLRALHIVCKCNNHIVGRVMIDNGSALNVCPVSTLKQMNVDMSRIRASKTTVRAFDGSRRDVIGEIDLLIDARRAKHLHRLATHYGKLFRGIPVPPLSQFFAAPPQIMGGTSDNPITETDDFSSDAVEAFFALLAIYAVTEETSSKVHIRPVQEDEELTNWTSVPLYSAVVADV